MCSTLSAALGADVDVTLIDRADAFTFGYSKLDVLFGKAALEDVRLPYRRVLKPGVRFLQESGIPPERMVPSGRGEYEPVAPNDTPEGRQKNRRIEIMLIDKALVSEMTRTAN